MLLKILLTVSVVIVTVGVLLYHPLPEGMDNSFSNQLAIGCFNLLRRAVLLRHYLGYGRVVKTLKYILPAPPEDKIPVTASYGDLKVTKEKMAGVPVIIYQPKELSKFHPGLMYFHGGGWTVGNSDMYDPLVYEYAKQTGTVAIFVDYRLAPEHPFPAGVNDCLDVTRFVLKNGAKYNIDVTKVGVAGDSAGGNLAAVVALKLSREKSDLPSLIFQVLDFPTLQAFDMLLPSFVDLNTTLPTLSQDWMASFVAAYVGIEDEQSMDHYTYVISHNRHIPDHLRKSKFAEFVDVKLLPVEFRTRKTPLPKIAAGHDEKVYAKMKDFVTNPLFSPLMSPDLSGLPPAFIHVCEFDVLRDDGLLYAGRLQDAGVKVKLHFGKGGYHGDTLFTRYSSSISGSAALSAAYAFIKEHIEQ